MHKKLIYNSVFNFIQAIFCKSSCRFDSTC